VNAVIETGHLRSDLRVRPQAANRTATDTMIHGTRMFRFLLAAPLIALAASPALAGELPVSSASPLFAGYWSDFLDHWGGILRKQNGIILVALCVGAVSLFIITRGKWKK
jgi:hypothetical protein